MGKQQRWWDDLPAPQITDHIYGVLRARHVAPEWLCYGEFRGAVGYRPGSDRSIDVLAVHLWSDRKVGRRPHVVSYEIKASRSDFAKELAHPEKRVTAERISTETWFAVPAGLVQVDEVPEGWGLLEILRGGKARAAKRAMQRDLQGWDWGTVLSILNRHHRDLHPDQHVWYQNARTNGTEKRWLYGDETLRKTLWRLQGLELTEEEILHVVQQHYEQSVQMAARRGQREAVQKWKESDREYRRMAELVEAVRGRLGGSRAPSAEAFEAWCRRHVDRDIPADIRESLVRLRDNLDRIVGDA